MRIKSFLSLVFSFAIILLAVPVFASQPRAIIIEPADGVGICRVGESYFRLKEKFKEPSSTKQLNNGDIIAKYSKPGIIIQYQGYTGEIHFVGIEKKMLGSSEYRTAEGLAVGMAKSKVESVFGNPEQLVDVTSKDVYPNSEKLAIYTKKGISFQYDSSERITVIIVFSPAVFGK